MIGLDLGETTNRQGGETQLTQVDNILQDIDKDETNEDIKEDEEEEKEQQPHSTDEDEEGDDVMDSDEYKKMLQKKGTAKYRFSLLQLHT